MTEPRGIKHTGEGPNKETAYLDKCSLRSTSLRRGFTDTALYLWFLPLSGIHNSPVRYEALGTVSRAIMLTNDYGVKTTCEVYFIGLQNIQPTRFQCRDNDHPKYLHTAQPSDRIC